MVLRTFVLSTLIPLLVSATRLVDFQVAQPVPVPADAKQCTSLVLQRDFASSYGSPEIVELVPPTECGSAGSWAAITLNFTVTSNGTQYDRLGIFTFRNVEIWRTSTPEPTRGDGIIWTYVKDVTQYTPLFANSGTFILELDNIIETGLDGVYSTTLHATYYASSPKHPPAKKADMIIPLSTLLNDTGNDASVPPGFSLNVTIPQNTIQLYAELFASGNGDEESWYFNVPNEFYSSIPSGLTYPDGPFREVRLLVDNQLAGVAFPYPVIFTGGFVPPAWRPITAYGALELPTYFVDLTPWVPLLTDGHPHTFTLDVASSELTHEIQQNWYVSGLLQVVTSGSSSKPTTGKMISYVADPYAVATTSGRVQGNGDVDFEIRATRAIRVEAEVVSATGNGEGGETTSTRVVWEQSLQYTNVQSWRDGGMVQLLQQTASGASSSTHNDVTVLQDMFSYPLNINFTFLAANEQNWTTYIDHSYNRVLQANPLVRGTTIKEQQRAGAFFQLATGGNYGNGSSSNTFSYDDTDGNTYTRRIDASNNVIMFDEVGGTLANEGETGEKMQLGGINDEFPAGARLQGGRRSG